MTAIMKGFALSSTVPEAPITKTIAQAIVLQLRRTELLWRAQLADPADANARMWGLVPNVELRWSAEIGAVDPDPALCVVQLVPALPPGSPPGDIAEHTVDGLGRPIAYISYVGAGSDWPSAASHEIAETRVDGPCTLQSAPAPDGSKWDREVCDPVQGSDYEDAAAPGVKVANVVSPRFFGLASEGPLDIASAVTTPFQELPEGYHDGDQGIVYGEKVSPAKREEVARKGVRGRYQKDSVLRPKGALNQLAKVIDVAMTMHAIAHLFSRKGAPFLDTATPAQIADWIIRHWPDEPAPPTTTP